MQIRELTEYLENQVPLKNQESYDNSGIICGDIDRDLTGVLICLDSMEYHVQEAIRKNCNLIIAHHPIIFGGIKKITPRDYAGRTVMKAIRHDISIYAIHTNLDNLLYNGVSEKIAKRLQLENLILLHPKNTICPDEPPLGAGVFGTLAAPMEEMDFLRMLKQEMNTQCIRHTKLLQKPIEKVAVCGGSGSFLLNKAINAGADVFISADFKYHDFFDANDNILIADIGHYESEQFTVEIIYDLITKRFRNFAAHLTELNSNPINYL